MRLPFKLPGMDMDPRRMALMNALKSQESAPMPTPAMRQMETPESTMGPPSVEDIMMQRTVTDQDVQDMYGPRVGGDDGSYPGENPDDFFSDTPRMDGTNPYMRENAMEDYSDPSYAPDMGQSFEEPTPQPGTPEFYEWLMNRVG